MFRQVILFYIVLRWANRGPPEILTICNCCSTFSEFFEDCEKSDEQICLVHHKSIILDQYASPGIFVVSRKNRFGFQFWLQSFFHDMQNVQFAHKFEKYKKIHRIRIGNKTFVTWAWLCALIVNSTWLVQTSNIILYSTPLGKSRSTRNPNYL